MNAGNWDVMSQNYNPNYSEASGCCTRAKGRRIHPRGELSARAHSKGRDWKTIAHRCGQALDQCGFWKCFFCLPFGCFHEQSPRLCRFSEKRWEVLTLIHRIAFDSNTSPSHRGGSFRCLTVRGTTYSGNRKPKWVLTLEIDLIRC